MKLLEVLLPRQEWGWVWRNHQWNPVGNHIYSASVCVYKFITAELFVLWLYYQAVKRVSSSMFPPTFQIIYNYYQYCCLVAKLCSALLRPYGLLLPIRLHCPWYFPGKNTGAGCHFLLQRIFPTQDSNCISCNSWIGRWVLYSWVTREAPTVITS